jgi:hypothetical protein
MKHIYKTFLVSTLSAFLILPTSVMATDIWIPSTIIISPTGDIAHKFPLPTSSDPGSGVGDSLGGGFFPVVGGSITNFKRIFALEGERGGPKKSKPLVEVSKGVFLPASSLGGYRVLEQSNKSLSLTLAATMGPGGWAGLNLSFAVSGTFAKGYQTNRYAKSIHDIKKNPKVKIPETIKELKNFSPGDSLAFNKKFTLGFSVSAAAGIIAQVGVGGSIASSWNVAFQIPSKKENPRGAPMVRLTYAKMKDKSFSVNAGNLISSFSIARAWGKSQSFEYLFDLSNKRKVPKINLKTEQKKGKVKETSIANVDVLMAYQEAIRGNLILADELAQRKKFGVTKVSETEKTSRGVTKSAGFKLPFLFNANFSRGKTFTMGKTKQFGNNKLVEEWLGVFNQQSTTSGIISKDSKRLNMFTGNYQQISPIKKMGDKVARRYSANYKYVYERNKVDVDKMQEELRKVRYKVGFMKHLRGLEIKPSGGNKVGSLKIELDVMLSNVATDELIKVAQKYGQAVLVKESLDYLEGFFANVKDAKAEICERYKTRILKECIFTTKRQTKSAMKTAYKALMTMQKHKKDVNYKDFVQSYADFGQGFIENRFTLKTFLRMLRYEFNPKAQGKAKWAKEKFVRFDGKRTHVPYEVKIKIQGTHIAPFQKVLKSWK